MKILIAGATGLVGQEVLALLDRDPGVAEVHVLSRRKIPGFSAKVSIHLSELGPDYLSSVSQLFFDAVLCCLGTTIKTAGSQAEFQKVDLDAVVQLARFTEHSQSKAFIVISSLGASPAALGFYSRIKGQMEFEVSRLQIPKIRILRPSLLLGKRKEFRFAEWIAGPVLKGLKGLLLGPLKKYRGIEAQVVARAMLALLHEDSLGSKVLESDQLAALGAKSEASFSA